MEDLILTREKARERKRGMTRRGIAETQGRRASFARIARIQRPSTHQKTVLSLTRNSKKSGKKRLEGSLSHLRSGPKKRTTRKEKTIHQMMKKTLAISPRTQAICVLT